MGGPLTPWLRCTHTQAALAGCEDKLERVVVVLKAKSPLVNFVLKKEPKQK